MRKSNKFDLDGWHVYLVTDRNYSKGRSLPEIVQAAVTGGVSVVQLREKNCETRHFYELGLEIREILRAANVPLIINDRIDIALALDADGVHLGQTDMPIEKARNLLGNDKILGLSINSVEEITEPGAALADYLAISPVFFTQTKTDIKTPWGLDGVKEARKLTRRHLTAIGSINKENASAVISNGADSIAVVTAITAADDPEKATAELVKLVTEAKARKLKQ